jgi:hypothetical protein
MVEFSAETLRFPKDREFMSLRSLKLQVSFFSVAEEHEPLTAKLIEPLSCGMLNLVAGVKVVKLSAIVPEQTKGKTRATIMAATSPVRTALLLVALKVSLYDSSMLYMGYKAFQLKALQMRPPAILKKN